MNSWLVDTHAALWFLQDAPELSGPAKERMESSASRLLISAASVWEIAIKARLGKLQAPDDLLDVLLDQDFEFLPVTPAHAWEVGHLPSGQHRDPFDRLLVAQAILEGVPIISADSQLEQYGVARLW